MLSLLPDCVHVAKSCKGSFGQERGNLSLFYTLRNKADPVVKGDVKKYLPSNDYVRNRDRQDPTAVLKLCNPDLCNYVSNIGLVTQTLVPETVRYTVKNQRGAFPKIIDVSVGPNGYILFLTYDDNEKKSVLYKAKLHNPVQDIEIISKHVKGTQVMYNKGFAFCCGSSSIISFYCLEKSEEPNLKVDKITTLQQMRTVLCKTGLNFEDTLEVRKEKLKKYQKSIYDIYAERNWQENVINIESSSNLAFDCLIAGGNNLMYVACSSSRKINSLAIKRDTIGLQAMMSNVACYGDSWKRVNSLVLFNDCVISLHDKGANIYNLATNSTQQIINEFQPHRGAQYKDGFLFTCLNKPKVFI